MIIGADIRLSEDEAVNAASESYARAQLHVRWAELGGEAFNERVRDHIVPSGQRSFSVRSIDWVSVDG